jgi:hypothetical protein
MALKAPPSIDDESALTRFHAGERDFIGLLYRETYDTVDATVGRILRGADRSRA